MGRIVKVVAKAKGFDPGKWHPHLLRHACGTTCTNLGAPLQAVAQVLGHADFFEMAYGFSLSNQAVFDLKFITQML